MNAGQFLTRAAERHPERPAWIDARRVVPFRQAADRVGRLAQALISLGGQPGDRVGVLIPNCPEGLEAILAPMQAGMVAVPMNIRLHPNEHAYMLNDSRAFVLIAGAELRPHVSQMREHLETVKHFIFAGPGEGGDLSYEALLECQGSLASSPAIEADDLAWIFYTSGTTGHPKGAMLTHRVLITMAEQFLLDIDPVVPSDVLLHAAPITHGSGLAMFHHLARGSASAFPAVRSFDPVGIFQAIERHRATTMFLVPTMINVLVGSAERGRYDLSSLKTVFYGGAPMYVEQLTEALRAFGPIFVQVFGQGEAPMTCTSLPKDEHLVGDDPIKLRRLASAGRATTAVQVRIVDENDRPVPPDTMGEIVVRGDLVMKGYWNRPDATAETLRGGWLHTGDIGSLDQDGYLYITDRKKDMIISGGSNIYPREIEEVICQHPAVFEVSVIGVPDDKWGEAVKALVVLRPGELATEDEIIEHCKRHLASYKKPQSVEFLPGLPKNAYGKVLKRELRDRYWVDRRRKV
jgi:acyl-CoA synthetase (AMP-forming)/AMP-acid ligase II